MKHVTNFWRIEIAEKIDTTISLIVSCGQISDVNIVSLLNTLAYKHMLSDDEILSTFCRKNSRRYSNCIDFVKSYRQGNLRKPQYFCQMSSITIVCSLISMDELSAIEIEKVR